MGCELEESALIFFCAMEFWDFSPQRMVKSRMDGQILQKSTELFGNCLSFTC